MSQVITVFGSSRTKEGTPGYESARELGAALARAGFTVANGGYGGTMEASARGAREVGGHTIGVTAELLEREVNATRNQWVEEEVRVRDWQERLFKLVEIGEGYVALPGGTGTLVELSVVWEWNNKGFFKKPRPVVLLGDYWHPVIDAIADGEIWNHSPLLRAPTPEEAVALFVNHLGRSND